MGRTPCCEKNGLKKGPWTQDEDRKLIDYIQKNGHGNWRTLPKNAGLQRCGKSCRLRWTNYLRPDIKRGRFSLEEEDTIIQLHSILGNKWSAIAARLPGRTDNEIKNYWNTHIRKRLLRMGIDPVTHTPRLDLLDFSSILNCSLYNDIATQIDFSRLVGAQALVSPQLLTLATSLLPSQHEPYHTSYLSPENQYHTLTENSYQLQAPMIHETPACNSTITSCVRFPDEVSQLMQSDLKPLPAKFADLSPQSSQFTCDWFNNGLSSNFAENHVPQLPSYSNNHYDAYDHQAIRNTSPESSAFQSNLDYNYGLISAMSTPSSNSASCINSCGTEDERESYSSNIRLKYEVPDSLGLSSCKE